MNIVTQFPVNLNLNFANPATEQARKESQMRELITQASDAEQSAAEKGLNSDTEKSFTRQQPLTYDYIKSQQSPAESQTQSKEALDNNSDGNATDEQENRGKERQQAQQEELDQQKIEELKKRDQEVRTHEQAHAAVGGQYAGSPSYEYERGPDGNNYAVGGEVKIDVSKVANDPQATIDKMQQVKRAALAPAEPSAQDRKVAAEADQKLQQARGDLLSEAADAIGEAGKVELTTDPTNTENQTPNVIKASDIAEHEINVQPVPFFEAKQSLEIEPEQLNFSETIAQADEQVTARALRIQKHYNVTSQPTQTSLSAYA